MNVTKQLLLATLNECQCIGGDKHWTCDQPKLIESELTSATGCVNIDHELRIIFVTFKGSKEFRDFIYDVKFRRQTVRIVNDKKVKAHSGFWEQMLSIKDGIDSMLETAMDTHSDYQVILTGHSLGGAVAPCYAVASSQVYKNACMITFGAPPPGNDELRDFVLGKVGHTFRVFNENDIVPNLLKPLGDRYIHAGYDIELKDKRHNGIAPANIAAGMVNHDTIVDYWEPIQHFGTGLNESVAV